MPHALAAFVHPMMRDLAKRNKSDGVRTSEPQAASSPASERTGLWAGLGEVYDCMSQPRRRQFFLVLILMPIGALAELAAIGAVIPFLSLLADPAGLDRFPWATWVFEEVGAGSGRERLIAATGLFALLVMVAALVRLQLTWSTESFIHRLGHDLAAEIQRRILFQPYDFHIHRNTATLISSVDKTETVIFSLLLPLMQAATASFIALFIIAALIYLAPFTATIAAAAFSLIYLLVSRLSRKRLHSNSAKVGMAWDERLKIVQESLGGIRDLIIDHSQSMYLRLFTRANLRLSLARANTAFIVAAPRYLIETVGMITIALIALAISEREGGVAAALPILGAIALGAQRLLPLLQQIYNGWSNAAGNSFVLWQVLDLLRLPMSDDEGQAEPPAPLPLMERISFDKVSFTYPSRRGYAVNEVTLEIPRGSAVALTGETGSGKSTLADLLMGLLQPDEGRISVDGVQLDRNRRRWRRSIAHVPQSIYLADTTIARNIALVLDEDRIDLERVIDAASKAQLHEFVASLEDGYDTVVGERGIRLSGGQRQRLGIARAIYKQTPVLVLDEPTSALDSATEAAVIDALETLRNEGRTIIIISHRPSAIARCDIVARLRRGRLAELGPADSAGDGCR